jgi:hypothetical protein
MNYTTDILDGVVKQAVKNLSGSKYPCKLKMSDLTQEVTRIYDERNMNDLLSKRMATSIGVAMSRLGAVKYHSGIRYWIVMQEL